MRLATKSGNQISGKGAFGWNHGFPQVSDFCDSQQWSDIWFIKFWLSVWIISTFWENIPGLSLWWIIKALQTVSLNLLINQSVDESTQRFTGQIRHVNKVHQKAD